MKPNLLFLAIAVVAFLGCATKPPPDPLTLQDVIDMAHADMSDHEIIREIEQSRTVFYLSSEDVIRLREADVRSAVIDYMLEARTRHAVEYERRRTFYDRHYYPYYPYYYDGGYRYYHHYYRPPPPRTHFPGPFPRRRGPVERDK